MVEDPLNAWAVEATAEFHGLYHVLLGTLDPLHGVGPDELTVAALVRARPGRRVHEVIVATNPTVEGEATAHYLVRALHAGRRQGDPHRLRAPGRRRDLVRRSGHAVPGTLGPAGDGLTANAQVILRRYERRQ